MEEIKKQESQYDALNKEKFNLELKRADLLQTCFHLMKKLSPDDESRIKKVLYDIVHANKPPQQKPDEFIKLSAGVINNICNVEKKTIAPVINANTKNTNPLPIVNTKTINPLPIVNANNVSSLPIVAINSTNPLPVGAVAANPLPVVSSYCKNLPQNIPILPKLLLAPDTTITPNPANLKSPLEVTVKGGNLVPKVRSKSSGKIIKFPVGSIPTNLQQKDGSLKVMVSSSNGTMQVKTLTPVFAVPMNTGNEKFFVKKSVLKVTPGQAQKSLITKSAVARTLNVTGVSDKTVTLNAPKGLQCIPIKYKITDKILENIRSGSKQAITVLKDSIKKD